MFLMPECLFCPSWFAVFILGLITYFSANKYSDINNLVIQNKYFFDLLRFDVSMVRHFGKKVKSVRRSRSDDSRSDDSVAGLSSVEPGCFLTGRHSDGADGNQKKMIFEQQIIFVIVLNCLKVLQNFWLQSFTVIGEFFNARMQKCKNICYMYFLLC